MQNLKRKVFNSSYLKRRHSQVKKALSLIHKQKNQNREVHVSDSLLSLIGYQFVSIHIAEMIETNKAIIVDSKKTRQSIIIREKSSYPHDVLDGWGASKYYLSGEKKFFLITTDWVS